MMIDKYIKIGLAFVSYILSVATVYSVQVVQETQKPAENEALKSIVVTIFTFLIMIFLGIGIIAVIVMIMVKIYKKLSDYKRKSKDYLYYDFQYQVNQIHITRDNQMKYRNPRRFWLFWKRMPVYVDTEDEGYKLIGMYNGEGYKKEDFLMIGLYNKLSLFKYINQIVIVPFKMKSTVRKMYVDGKKVLIIKAEGVDNVANTDYYYMPLYKDKTDNDHEFIDFADYIHKNFFESVVYRDVINKNLQQYREGVIKSVETNPNIHFKRRGE